MKLKFSDVFFKGALEFNPVLVQCVGLCPVIIASSNLRDAAFMSVFIIADLLVTGFLASAVLRKVPRYIRVALYLVIGLAIIVPVLWYIENMTLINMTLGMRIYIPLIAINSVTAVHCEQFAVKNNVRMAVFDSLAAGFGVSFVMLFCGAVREILGSGTIGGYDLGLSFHLDGMLMPYGCLIILGFMSAVMKAVFSFEKKAGRRKSSGNEGPEEINLDITKESDPSEVDMDFSFENDDDEYAYLLSSVNELIDSFSRKEEEDGGDEE